MKIKILGIKDGGDLENERIVLVALDDVDIGNYMTGYAKETGETTVATDILSPFWFPDTDIRKGDRVIVYTRKGQSGRKVSEDGSSLYFYYRNNDVALCVSDTIGGIVFEIKDWSFESNRLQ